MEAENTLNNKIKDTDGFSSDDSIPDLIIFSRPGLSKDTFRPGPNPFSRSVHSKDTSRPGHNVLSRPSLSSNTSRPGSNSRTGLSRDASRHDPSNLIRSTNKILKPRNNFDINLHRKNILGTLSVEEITYLIEVGMSKGNRFEQIIEHLHIKGQKKKYENIVKKTGDTLLTLSRLCQAFPEITCQLLHDSPSIGNIKMKTCIEVTGLEDFPSVARHTACSSIIPLNFNFRAEALEVILMCDLILSERIQTDEWRQLPCKERFCKTFDYLLKSLESPVFAEFERWELIKKYGIVSDSDILSESWMKAADEANKYLQLNYECTLKITGTGSSGIDIVYQPRRKPGFWGSENNN